MKIYSKKYCYLIEISHISYRTAHTFVSRGDIRKAKIINPNFKTLFMKKFVALATLLLLTASALWAQKLDVTGSVIDGNGVPVVGASVVIKGKTTGTTTDAKGHFSLSASKGDVLTVSFIGYKPVEAAAAAPMKITLEEESQAGDEGVVVG